MTEPLIGRVITGPAEDPFDVARDYVEHGIRDFGTFRREYVGPWHYRDDELIVAPHFALSRLGGVVYPEPPEPVCKMVATFALEPEVVADVSIAELRDWAGSPLHIRCICRVCDRGSATPQSTKAGWLGRYLVDRRLVALALGLAGPDEDRCNVRLLPPPTGHGGPIRLDGATWWAAIMGMRDVPALEPEPPRFEL